MSLSCKQSLLGNCVSLGYDLITENPAEWKEHTQALPELHVPRLLFRWLLP